MFLHIGNGGAKGVRIFGPPLPTVSIVIHCAVSLLYALHPFTDEFVFPCREVGVNFMDKLTCFAFAGILIICGRDVKQGHTALGQSASLAESSTSSSPPLASSPERTSTLPTDAAPKWTNLAPALALDLAGDSPWTHCHCRTRNPILMNSMSSNDSLLIRAQMPTLARKEEPDCEQCGEGDLARLRLEESVLWRKNWREDHPTGGLRHLSECVGAVEVEVDGPVPTVAAALPPVLRIIASFKMSSAFLQLSKDGVWWRFRLWSPNQAEHKLQVRTRRWWVTGSGMQGLPETRGVFPGDGAKHRGWHIMVLQCPCYLKHRSPEDFKQ